MIMNVTIIKANADDAVEILTLQKLVYESEARLYRDWNIPPLTQTISEIEAEFKANVFLKAVSGERIIGSVRGWLASGTCRIGRLIVHPDYQGNGIGTLLMEGIERAFPGADRFELFTGTRSVANIRLYRSLGYRECREEELSPEVRLVFIEKLPVTSR